MGWVNTESFICAKDALTLARLAMYLEYGIRFPLTGGELHYVRPVT